MAPAFDLKNPTCKSVLARYSSSIVQMRQQHAKKQFGLVFGAGIGTDLGFPSWKVLLERIARHKDVDGQVILDRTTNTTARAQQLFQKFKADQDLKATPADRRRKMLEMKVRANWRRVVHECLYQGIPAKDIGARLAKDRYLEAFTDIICDSPLTVTYNFDDTLQQMLDKNRPAKTGARGYRTYWSGNVQLRPSKGGVIYHPNGFLPSTLRDRPSDQLVFLEDSFADQLIDSMSGHYASLATHLSQTTCLLIGLSLDDPTLKHLLRQSSRSFPGHFHHYVHFVGDPATLDEEHRKIEAAANFDVYNLITLHLTAEEIRAVATLIQAPSQEFCLLAEEMGIPVSFKYYVVGSVGAGKSTSVSFFRSLTTQDEWTEKRAEGMEKAPELLDAAETERIDAWVAEQLADKNMRLKLSSVEGIHVIDRAPLDAFAFTDHPKWKEKAERIRKSIVKDHAKDRRIVAGHVIFLKGNPEIMAERAISLHKETDKIKLEKQQGDLLTVYVNPTISHGCTVLDVEGKTSTEVVKEISAVIFREPYVEANLHDRLLEIEGEGHA